MILSSSALFHCFLYVFRTLSWICSQFRTCCIYSTKQIDRYHSMSQQLIKSSFHQSWSTCSCKKWISVYVMAAELGSWIRRKFFFIILLFRYYWNYQRSNLRHEFVVQVTSNVKNVLNMCWKGTYVLHPWHLA